MHVLALDVATMTGFADGRAGAVPSFGQVRLKTPDDEAKRGPRNMGCWLRDRMILSTPDLIAYEAPLNSAAALSKGNSYHTPDMLLQMIGAVEAVAGCYGVRTKAVHVQSVRKKFLGNGRPPDPKRAVIEHCRRLGFAVKTDNEADAVAIWFVECGYIYGQLPLAGAVSHG